MTSPAGTDDPAGPMPPSGIELADGSTAPAAGRNELGSITVSESVVAKLAAQAALEVPDAGAAAPRLLGRSLSGAGGAGGPVQQPARAAEGHAEVDGSLALVRLELSVRWPGSVPAVTAAVRDRVRSRLAELAGLEVPEVTIRVTDLVTEPVEATPAGCAEQREAT